MRHEAHDGDGRVGVSCRRDGMVSHPKTSSACRVAEDTEEHVLAFAHDAVSCSVRMDITSRLRRRHRERSSRERFEIRRHILAGYGMVSACLSFQFMHRNSHRTAGPTVNASSTKNTTTTTTTPRPSLSHTHHTMRHTRQTDTHTHDTRHPDRTNAAKQTTPVGEGENQTDMQKRTQSREEQRREENVTRVFSAVDTGSQSVVSMPVAQCGSHFQKKNSPLTSPQIQSPRSKHNSGQ